ncbi:MAG: ArsR family transcriptional regulator [Planctomycetaceae bacterium]
MTDNHGTADSDSESEPIREAETEDDMISSLSELDKGRKVASTGLPDQLEQDLVQTFKLLSDETRLRVLMYLMREGELHVTALCERLDQSQPAVSHHLALLRVAGLIEARRDGKHNFYSVRREHFHRIMGELFSNMTAETGESLRFSDFVLRQDESSTTD